MTTPRIVILDVGSIGDDCLWPDFASLGQVDIYQNTMPEEVLERLQGATAVLTNKVVITKEHIDMLPNLRYVGTMATGYNQVAIDVARARNIPVCNVPDYSTPSVMQHTFGLILDLACKISMHAEAVRQGAWAKSSHFCFWIEPGMELAGKTLGVVGFGNTGQAVARMGHYFGMKVQAYAPRPKPIPEYSPFTFMELEELFETSDIVTLHCPLTPENTAMVNAKLLSRMKRSAFLINCARGPLVYDQDLADALNSGRIAGAGLDVVTLEPMPDANPLRTAKNCIITPHIAWSSVEARSRLMQGVFDNLKNFLNGTPTNVVNP